MRALVVVAALLLGACSTPEGNNPFDQLHAAAARDALVAHQMALMAEDKAAMRCWATVAEKAAKTAGRAQREPVGPLSAWQKARNVRRGIDEGMDEDIRADCAVLVLDALRTTGRIVRRAVPVF